ncbi:MAG: hypothetical protein Q8N23_17845 [Archangium sp.]|nr:hypothetical protein [Archangium sp.]MDP3569415.1 hypothetical protein [Archangium sp.]
MLSNLLIATLLLVSSETPEEPAWKAMRTVDGLTISAREVNGSHFEEVMVTTLSMQPLAALCDAVWGRDAKVEGHFKKRVVIRESHSERWTYEQLKVPIVTDRDIVVHSQLVASADTGRCEVLFETGTDPDFPKTRDHVRVTSLRGRWTLEPTTDGKVAITYTVYSEPGGKIPAWMARGGQRDAALIFMKTILSRAAGP